MLVSEFDFHLPEELIAQQPLDDRSASRMLVLDRAGGGWEDRQFRDIPDYLQPGDRLAVNNSKVIPARLFGRRQGTADTNARDAISALVEVFLVKQIATEPQTWEALIRPGRKIRVGEVIIFPGGLEAVVTQRGEFGLRTVEFRNYNSFHSELERIGHVPLPPYIKRSDTNEDRNRYQTVFARQEGSVAAPTAGLHFTPEILKRIGDSGVVPVEITLHVGLGTFQPIRVETVEGHQMHSEIFTISPEAAQSLNAADRVVAVGTTTVRTIEHAARAGRIAPGSGETDIFIHPGYRFRKVGAMLTNFHLPQSTLLMLVAAFAGKDLALAAYRHAVEQEYRFYSYGDCMLIL